MRERYNEELNHQASTLDSIFHYGGGQREELMLKEIARSLKALVLMMEYDRFGVELIEERQAKRTEAPAPPNPVHAWCAPSDSALGF